MSCKQQFILICIKKRDLEMGKTVENYMLMQPLGEGTFAKVYKAKHIKTGQDFAIKVISSEKFKDTPKLQQCTVNQINVLTQIRHECQYIVNYIDMLKTTNNFYFVYEFCNGGTLDRMIQKEGFFPEQKAIKYLRQILQAFRILNRHNIMHRDLKPQNILIHNGNIKIADFSFCKLLQNKNDLTQTMLGSPIYMAPQVLKGQIYTTKADVWSMGVVFYQMLFGKCPFQSKSIALLIKLLQKQELYLPSEPKISPITQQFLRRVLVKDPNQRITWDELFNTYHLTEQGQIVNKRDLMVHQQQMELRSSIRSTNGVNGYGFSNRVPGPSTGLTIQTQGNTYNNNPSLNFSSPKSGYMIPSPANGNTLPFNRSMEFNPIETLVQSPIVEKNFISKRSPTKYQDQRNTTDFRGGFNLNSSSSTNTTNNNSQNNGQMPQTQRLSSYQSNNYFQSQQNIGPIEGYSRLNHQNSLNLDNSSHHPKSQPGGVKNDRVALTRIQIFTKNHLKLIQINQLALDIFQLQQQYSNYICYFLFKNICKQIEALHQNLKKQSVYDQTCRDFRITVENQLQNITIIANNFFDAISEQQKEIKILGQSNPWNKNLDELLLENKPKILRMYIQKLNDTDEDVRLASQVVDFLEQNILIKREAYDRMSREHLYKQMKNKVMKE